MADDDGIHGCDHAIDTKSRTILLPVIEDVDFAILLNLFDEDNGLLAILSIFDDVVNAQSKVCR